MSILYQINKNLTSKTNKPKQDIIIERMHVYENPFRRAIKKLKDEIENEKNASQDKKEKNSQRWIENEK